ncbi:MAG: hypothetical protein JWO73_950 [Candidatus Taylorbacteria bacterium]|nr:hypothetical protein [Candidatus Taylorbacteria bacterium]
MKTAIIIHGMPDKENYFNPSSDSQSNCHWLPWLQQQLIAKGILAQTPEMPVPYEPDYAAWCEIFERLAPDEETLLVGHSLGGGFLVRWLSEHTVKVGPVMLVAPWTDPDNEMRDALGNFFDYEIDPDLVSRTDGMTIFYSTDDEANIIKTSEILEKSLKGSRTMKFEGKGHFCLRNLGTREFPELLQEALQTNR